MIYITVYTAGACGNVVCIFVCVCVCALTNERKHSNRQDVQEEDVHDKIKAVHNVHQNSGDSQYMYTHTYIMDACV